MTRYTHDYVMQDGKIKLQQHTRHGTTDINNMCVSMQMHYPSQTDIIFKKVLNSLFSTAEDCDCSACPHGTASSS